MVVVGIFIHRIVLRREKRGFPPQQKTSLLIKTSGRLILSSSAEIAGRYDFFFVRFFGFSTVFAGVVAGDEHVDRRDHEEGEERTDGHAADEHQADGIARFGTGPGDQC
jgi:hypothetical protein